MKGSMIEVKRQMGGACTTNSPNEGSSNAIRYLSQYLYTLTLYLKIDIYCIFSKVYDKIAIKKFISSMFPKNKCII